MSIDKEREAFEQWAEEREAFEQWAEEHGHPFAKASFVGCFNEFDDYDYQTTETLWVGWQARASRTPNAQAVASAIETYVCGKCPTLMRGASCSFHFDRCHEEFTEEAEIIVKLFEAPK